MVEVVLIPSRFIKSVQFSSVQFSHSVVSDSLQPHGLQHTRPPYLSPTAGVYSNSCPLSQYAIQPSILCHPLLLLPSIFPSIRVFSYESVLRIRWPMHCSFSFSIHPSNEHSGLSRVFSNTTVQKYQFFSIQLTLQSNCHTHTWLLEKQ